MKIPIYALAMAALLGGPAMAGDSPRSDSPHDMMRADTDGDGRISRAEATAAGSQKSGAWFDKLDTNHDGYVTQEEISQAKATRRADMKQRFEERFGEADTNKDGQLSLDEVQAKMPRLADRFTTLDKDKNGFLSKEELAHGGHGPHRRPEPQS
jgi:Ca2+-binding EF-hand superfamily protein